MTQLPSVHSPATLDDAYAILADREASGVTVLAGGTDLMVLANAHQLDAGDFIDIWRLNELRGIEDQGDTLRIGALTTYTQLIQSGLIREHAPSLVEASRTIGAIQIQNRGTIGGNVVNASPAGDSLPVLAAFDAEIEIGSSRGVRRVDFNHFYTGYRRTVLEPGELVLAVRMPKLRAGEHSFFFKVGTRRAQAISKVVMGARLSVDAGFVSSVSIAVGSVAPTVIRATRTEALLNSERLTEVLAARAQLSITEEVSPISDLRSTAHYRRTVTGNLLFKVLRGFL